MDGSDNELSFNVIAWDSGRFIINDDLKQKCFSIKVCIIVTLLNG